MRILFLAFTLLQVSSLGLKGQESIGFSDSSNFQQLIDYRLPSWGYSQFSINSGGLNVSGQKTNRSNTQGRYDINRETQDQTSSSLSERFSISPSYFRYEESEQRILQLSTSANFTIAFRKAIVRHLKRRRKIEILKHAHSIIIFPTHSMQITPDT